jgi:hypothetical protein
MTEEQQRVILYGDSLILAGVQASLGLSPNLEVIALGEPPADLTPLLSDLHPEAVIFDLGAIQPDFLRALVQQPGLLLIGIDPETHEATVLSGHQAQAETTRDLVQVINALHRRRSLPPAWPGLHRLRQLASGAAAWRPRRRHKLILALAGIAVSVIFAAAFLLPGSNLNVPLAGTAVVSRDGFAGMEFGAGIMLGALAIGLFFWLRGRRANGH